MHILITGASSGLGAALAAHYAAPGVALALHGRDNARLAEVAARCRAAGAEVDTFIGDVRARAALESWVAARDAARPLDLVVANAGLSAGTGGGIETDEQTWRIFDTNVGGVLSTVLPALAGMRARQRGHIAIMASLAGFRGMPGAPAYCASKAAVKVWGEALRGTLAADNIAVSVICPGFVTTGMTKHNRFPMPFLMDAGRAARIIAIGLNKRKGRIAFPWPMAVLAWLGAALPDALAHRLTRRLPAKEAAA
ncbi:MAG: SDR family NAD(P)-dependent oxidoreductase [Rhodospirillaceae bacterium]|nr:SDR family NAD(P)-dependent oxidoreductase [Rhodospirillaceae bacterium]